MMPITATSKAAGRIRRIDPPEPFMNPILGVAQVALTVRDVPRATAFYRDTLGLTHLFDAPNMSLFDAAGVRLMLSAPSGGAEPGGRGTLVYFKVADVKDVHARLAGQGVKFEQPPHVIARHAGREVWLAWLQDPDANLVGLMSEKAAG